MSHLPRRIACGILIAGGSLAGTALAADPGDGQVSAAAPKTTWKGETTASYLLRAPTAVTDSTDTPCEAPACDEYKLKVADSATLTVGQTLASDSETAAITLRIIKPDGTIVQTDSDPGAPAAGKYFKVVIKNAKTGDYTIQHYNNSAQPMTYDSYAELAVPAAPTQPPGGGAGGGGQTPAPGGAPTQAPPSTGGGGAQPGVQAIAIKVKVRKTSARKLKRKRKLVARVTVSRPVTSLSAALKKGKKVVGKGKRGATKGTVKLRVKLSKKAAKKLKRGKYKLTVLASDGKTSSTKTVKVRLRK
jgi:hypothetical protein